MIPPLAKPVLACLLPLTAGGQIIMQTTTPDNMTGDPIELGDSPSGITLSHTATIETTATPASASKMDLEEEPPPQLHQSTPYTPEFDVNKRYSLKEAPAPKKNDQPQAIVPKATPAPKVFLPQSLPADEATPAQPAGNPVNILLGQPQPTPEEAFPETDWQNQKATLSAPQTFSITPEIPTNLTLEPDPTPSTPQE
jgi:hypothetical protein